MKTILLIEDNTDIFKDRLPLRELEESPIAADDTLTN